MGDYVKKSMSSDWTRFRDLKVRACLPSPGPPGDAH
jgi:hypothetical protein